MRKNFPKINKLRLIVIGGNRLNEEYPFKHLISLKKIQFFFKYIYRKNSS